MKDLLKKVLLKLGMFEYISYLKTKIKYKYMECKYNSTEAKEKYIKKYFKKCVGYDIDFAKEPVTFNQKIQFRKLYDNNPLYSVCADKYRVRDYIKNKIGEKYLIPLYLVTDKLTVEQWNELPSSFVAKANHNSGPVQIVKDKTKVNSQKVITELNRQLKIDYGVLSMEKYYSDIPRKIIVEKYLVEEILDYRFHCFKNVDGQETIYVQVTDSELEVSGMYNALTWEKINVGNGYKVVEGVQAKPDNYKKMLEIVQILSNDFDYVRVDLYNVDGKIYVGELTFCDCSGFGKFTDEDWDYKFGSFWNQPKLR